ncbi:MAG: hypothetical protein F6K57_06185 [Moorea sp. SIO4A5]|nr:hypothetical protein [Moorena sp. SIO4A5]
MLQPRALATSRNAYGMISSRLLNTSSRLGRFKTSRPTLTIEIPSWIVTFFLLALLISS